MRFQLRGVRRAGHPRPGVEALQKSGAFRSAQQLRPSVHGEGQPRGSPRPPSRRARSASVGPRAGTDRVARAAHRRSAARCSPPPKGARGRPGFREGRRFDAPSGRQAGEELGAGAGWRRGLAETTTGAEVESIGHVRAPGSASRECPGQARPHPPPRGTKRNRLSGSIRGSQASGWLPPSPHAILGALRPLASCERVPSGGAGRDDFGGSVSLGRAIGFREQPEGGRREMTRRAAPGGAHIGSVPTTTAR
jgi:hypothetical protein